MSLELPSTFSFSQSSLQAFENCPRRFWLAYVERLSWPAVEVSPYDEQEQMLKLGAQFHQLIERTEVGLPADVLTDGLDHPLDEWFESYQRHRPADLPTEFVEVEGVLSVPFAQGSEQYRLTARYDLIAVGGEERRAVILDWKTNRRPNSRAVLQQHLQTVVYPFVLVEASAGLPWGPVTPEQVEMRYWFTAAPTEPTVFGYSSDRHAANRSRLLGLLDKILSGERQADFPKVPDTQENRRRFCNYCVYRSRCNRGVGASPLPEGTDEVEFLDVDRERSLDFSLEEVEELAF